MNLFLLKNRGLRLSLVSGCALLMAFLIGPIMTMGVITPSTYPFIAQAVGGIKVAKTANITTAYQGGAAYPGLPQPGEIEYTIVLTNNTGSAINPPFYISDTVPAGTVCSYIDNGGLGNWTAFFATCSSGTAQFYMGSGSWATGTIITMTFRVKPDGQRGGFPSNQVTDDGVYTVTNTAVMLHNPAGGGSFNGGLVAITDGSDNVNVATMVKAPVWAITKSAPITVNAGDMVLYNLNIANTGVYTLNPTTGSVPITITENVPLGVASGPITATNLQDIGGGIGYTSIVGNQVTWVITAPTFSLEPGSSFVALYGQPLMVTYTTFATLPHNFGIINNSYNVQGSNNVYWPGNGSAAVTTINNASMNCYATINGVTVYSSTNAQAVQQAVSAANPGDTVKVVGTCAGVQTISGLTQTVAITKNITLQGGYTHTTWAFNPISYPTTLDALGGGRVISATTPITVADMKVQNGKWTVNNEHGGGIYVGAAAIISNVTVFNNRVPISCTVSCSGGGIYINGGLAQIISSTIISNTASSGGRGAGAYFGNNAVITQSVFQNNYGVTNGGGAYFHRPAMLTNSTFENNQTNSIGNGGGAFFNDVATIQNSVFKNNMAQDGGAIYHWTNAMTLTNVLLARNTALSFGSAIYNINGGGGNSAYLRHVTIVGPITTSVAAVHLQGGLAYITNTIIDSYDIGIEQNATAIVEENFNLFNNTAFSGTIIHGSNSITGAAAFYDTNAYTLTAASAAIDKGFNLGITTDFEGQPRPQGSAPDIGYDESPYSLSFNCYATFNNGTTVYSSTDASAVQQAVDNAAAGNTVKVAGTCAGVQVRAALTQTVYLSQSVTVEGGYTTTNWLTPYPFTQTTTLDALGGGRVAYIPSGISITMTNIRLTNGLIDGDGGGIYHSGSSLVLLTHTIVISNRTISNGNSRGGGIHLFTGTTTLLNGGQVISNSSEGGGGINMSGGIMTFSAGLIAQNTATVLDGGGININSSGQVTITGNSQIYHNTSNRHGGGININNMGQVILMGNGQILSNTALVTGNGGGINITGGQFMLMGNGQILSNTAYKGGGMATSAAGAVLSYTSGLVAYNQAIYGGGIYLNNGAISVTGGRILTNAATINGGAIYQHTGGITITNSCIVSNSSTSVHWAGGVTPLVATANWWGAPSGPTPTGSGDSVSSNVDYSGYSSTVILGCPTLNTNTPDLSIIKTVNPAIVAVGNMVTYTIAFSNVGSGTAHNAFITDTFPTNIINLNIISSGLAITQTIGYPNFTWSFAPISSSLGGIITITGVVPLTSGLGIVTNSVQITGTGDITLSNNSATAPLNVTGGNCYANLNGTIYNTADASAVQAAVDAAIPNDIVKIAGTCVGVQNRVGVTQTVYISQNLTLQGGYTLTNWTNPTPANATTLDAQGNGRVIYATNNQLFLYGLKLTNGYINGDGGGIFAVSSDVILSGSLVISNAASFNGGGISSNFAIHALNSNFISNTAQSGHGGAIDGRSQVVLTNTTLIDNRASEGGGLYSLGGGQLINVLLAGNSATNNGAAIYQAGLSVTLTVLHTTIANPALNPKPGIYATSGTISVRNTIIFNQATGLEQAGTATINEDYNLFSSTSPYAGTIMSGGHSLTGTASFYNTTAYTLTVTSAAIDAGAYIGITTDFEGQPRPQGSAPDIGYDESPYTSIPNLSLNKTVIPTSGLPGSAITYILSFSNTGTGIVTHSTLIDTIPAGIALPMTVISSGVPISQTSGLTYSWTIPSLAPGQSGIITLSGQVAASATVGLINNIATIATSNGITTATAAFTVIGGAEVMVTKEVMPQTAAVGDSITYTLRLSNVGSVAANNVVITDLMPTNVTNVSNKYTFTVLAALATPPMYQWNLGTLGAGQSYIIQIKGVVATAGSFDNIVTVTATNDTDGSNNTAIVTTDAVTPTVFTVNSNNDTDDGVCSAQHCSLREAIQAANSNDITLNNTILFNLPVTNATISITTSLPTLETPTWLNGLSQPGADCSSWPPQLRVELNGNGLNFNGLTLNGGQSMVEGLVINNFGQHGVVVSSDSNVLHCNFIGTNRLGTDNRGNGLMGVYISAASNQLQQNLISANKNGGVVITGTAAQANVLEQNYIGTEVTGKTALGNNGRGLSLGAASQTQIRQNIIAFNRKAGLVIAGATATQNFLSQNSVFENGLLGVNLNAIDSLVTANDADDSDSGPNELQNYPVLTEVTDLGGTLKVTGYLNSRPNETYLLEFFANRRCDFSGYGEGERYLDLWNVTTDSLGEAAFTLYLPGQAGDIITANATDSNGNTSEFGACITARESTNLQIFKSVDLSEASEGDLITYALEYYNQSDTVTATNVIITDILPDELNQPSYAISTNSYTEQIGMTYVWELGDLPPYSSGIIVITATVIDLGNLNITNTAMISSTTPELTPEDNVSLVTTTLLAPAADLELIKTVTPTQLMAGNWLTYTLWFTNHGTRVATDIRLTDGLPPELINSSYEVTGVVITPTNAFNYEWNMADLAPGEGGIITITAQVNPNTPNMVLTNHATLFTTAFENNYTNNDSLVSIGVTARPSFNFSQASYLTLENQTQAVITVTLTSPLNKVATVDYKTINSTATAFGDYLPISGTLIFQPGETQQTLLVPLINDQIAEIDEAINLDLSQPVGAELGLKTAVLVITDDDFAGAAIAPTQLQLLEGGPKVNYTIRLLTQPTAQVTITLTSLQGQLILTPTILIFTPNNWNITQTISVIAIDDSLVENLHNDTIKHVITSPDPLYQGVTLTQVQAIITDNDLPPTTLTLTHGNPTVINQAIPFTATLVGGQGSYTYSWNFGDGTLISSGGQNSLSHTYSLTGSYTLIVTATHGLEIVTASISIPISATPLTDLLQVTHSLSFPSIEVGGFVTYRITVRNISSSPAHNVYLTHTWPISNGEPIFNGFTPQTSMPLAVLQTTQATAEPCSFQEAQLRCFMATLPAGSRATINLMLSPRWPGSAWLSRVEANAKEVDPNITNNSAETLLTVTAPPIQAAEVVTPAKSHQIYLPILIKE